MVFHDEARQGMHAEVKWVWWPLPRQQRRPWSSATSAWQRGRAWVLPPLAGTAAISDGCTSQTRRTGQRPGKEPGHTGLAGREHSMYTYETATIAAHSEGSGRVITLEISLDWCATDTPAVDSTQLLGHLRSLRGKPPSGDAFIVRRCMFYSTD